MQIAFTREEIEEIILSHANCLTNQKFQFNKVSADVYSTMASVVIVSRDEPKQMAVPL